MDTAVMPLETETQYFEQHRDQWIADGHEGEWCVVKGQRLLGFFPDLSAAYDAGAHAFGADVDFLVHQVLPEDPIATIQRVNWLPDEPRSIERKS